jgi:hypothetical protein
MISIRTSCAVSALTWLCFTPLIAQDKGAIDRLSSAHAQYYTPTASGLKSFRCEAAIDWKAMLTRLSGKEIPDDNPALKYLQTVHLSVADELNGQGSMDWTSSDVPPEGKEEGFKQMREGLQTTVAGFFQSWNAYMNGSMVPLPDRTVTVIRSGDGFHLSAGATDTKIDEDFDKNMLLLQVRVVTPDLKVLATPTYIGTADGLLVTSVNSRINQPPTAPETEVTFRVEYAKVESFQLPSRLVVDVKNTGGFDFAFSACKVSVTDWAKKP